MPDTSQRSTKVPSATFPTPDAVVRSALTTERKIEILRGWELDARGLAVADDENMTGSGSAASVLQEIRDALRALGAAGDPQQAAATKHGGGA